jgi:ParB family transcriptional regulator, chromosome partitioning protein
MSAGAGLVTAGGGHRVRVRGLAFRTQRLSDLALQSGSPAASTDETRQSPQPPSSHIKEAARRAPAAEAAEEGEALKASPPEEARAAAGEAPPTAGLPLSTWPGRLPREAHGGERGAEAGAPTPTPASSGGSPTRRVPVAQLAPGRFRTRAAIDPEVISALAQSIRAHGVLQPILVLTRPAGGGYEIIAGERRWRAAREAGLVEAPVNVLEVADRAAMEIALVENLQRQDLSPLEEAEGYRRLIEELGETQERLAEVVGKSRSHVANTLRLLRLPPPIKALLAEGKLSAGHARALLSAADPEALAHRTVEAGLSVRETERLAQQAAPEPAAALAETGSAPAQAGGVAGIEAELSGLLGAVVKIALRGKGERGTLTIRFTGLAKLRELIERLRP